MSRGNFADPELTVIWTQPNERNGDGAIYHPPQNHPARGRTTKSETLNRFIYWGLIRGWFSRRVDVPSGPMSEGQNLVRIVGRIAAHREE